MLHDFVLNLFQFHEGPIKTLLGGYALYVLGLFQFHEGPIKTIFLLLLLLLVCVSIP